MINGGLFLLICGIILLISYILIYDNVRNTETLNAIYSFIIIGILFLMFIMSLVFENDNKQIASTYQNKTRQLLSLTDSNKSETKGIYVGTPIFSYGVVSKKDQMYYRVIAGNEKVGYRVKEFDVYKTPLFFINEKELPKTEEVYKIIKYRKVGNFLFGGIIKMSEKSRTFENKVFIENRLYIPKSAVKIEFNVDGE